MTANVIRPLRRNPVVGGVLAVVLAVAAGVVFATSATAQAAPVGLGAANSFAVLGGSTVTNTGPTVVNGDLGVSPGTAITGFPPGTVNGTTHAADAAAGQAQTALTTAYNDAAGRPCGTVLTGQDLGGLTLTAGVYCFSSSAGLTGTLTLDGQGDPDAAFIFQIGSTLTTASGSNVTMINAAQSCNAFWQVGSSATLGTTTTFRGNIMALTSISLTTGATVDGRALARNGAVTMDSNTVTRSVCTTAAPTPTPTPTPTPAPTTSPTTAPTSSPTPTPAPTTSPTPAPTPAPTTPTTTTPTPTPVQPPTRIDTGAGGADASGGSSRVLLLLVAGAVTAGVIVRRRSGTDRG